MNFEWDEGKRLAKVHKHGFDFVDVMAVFEGDIVTIEDDRFEDEEQRFVTLGLLNGRGIVIIHTEREDVTRIISVRKATKNEERSYFEQIAN